MTFDKLMYYIKNLKSAAEAHKKADCDVTCNVSLGALRDAACALAKPIQRGGMLDSREMLTLAQALDFNEWPH